jgi:hypothetical protein
LLDYFVIIDGQHFCSIYVSPVDGIEMVDHLIGLCTGGGVF